jgi:hypothetical protein
MNVSVFLSVYGERLIVKYVLYRKESAILWENIPYVKLYEYNQNYIYLKLNGYWGNGEVSFKESELLYFIDYRIHIKMRRSL